jgi:hypothetical protein
VTLHRRRSVGADQRYKEFKMVALYDQDQEKKLLRVTRQGPERAGCKSEARRLKGVGMRWNGRNAEAMLALEALHPSNRWNNYWNSRTKAAA